ncbi:MAG: GAF domain-containing protein, partial [Myxococcales bacterium]|nr:GAF domain-containing protein [Myxococcales bacterium]
SYAHELETVLAAIEARGGGVHEACMLGFYYVTVAHYQVPWRSLLPRLERARHAGLESGDLLFLSYICSHLAIARLILGNPLEAVREQVDAMLATMERRHMASAAATQRVVRQTIACLEGRSAGPTSLAEPDSPDPDRSEDEWVASMVEARMSFALSWYRISKGTLYLLDGDPQAALVQLEQLTTMTPNAFTPEGRFITALALLGCGEDLIDDARARLLADCRRDLEIWAEASPGNHQHRLLLVEAEHARREGRLGEAMAAYDRAIEIAGAHEWPRDQALASELAARFYLGLGRRRIARAYMIDAVYGYARWGAGARVRVLAERHPDLVPIEVEQAALRTRAESLGVLDDAVDMLAFVRSLQAIAREVVLEDVVERIMQTVLQSAGAGRALLVLERDGVRTIYAEATAAPLRVELGLDLPLEDGAPLAASVARYVARSGEAVVLDDATHDQRFAGDPYIVRKRSRSLACLALGHQGRSRGLLYLENDVVTAAFTRRRLELLELFDRSDRSDRSDRVSPRVVVVSAEPDVDMAIAALRHGVDDFLPKPIDLEVLLRLVAESRPEATSGSQPVLAGTGLSAELERYAASDLPLLLTGETGTGKTCLAR